MISKLLEIEYKNISEQLSKNLYCLRGKSILITGASGLIGSYLTSYLLYLNKENSFDLKIYGMARSLEKLKKHFGTDNSGLIFIEQDLTEELKSRNHYDYIIHAASNAHPLAFSKDPAGTMKTNLIGTMNLLESIKNSDTKFLYISSGEIYGNNTDSAFCEDDLGLVDTKSTRACYPESKRAAETLCIAYASQFDIRVNIARLCYVYGATITETSSRADAQFLRNALNGKDIVMKSEGLQKRTYCYIADAVCALLYILLNGGRNEFYNVANSNSIVSINEYAQTLAEISDVKLRFELPDEIEARGYSKPANSILNADKLVNLGWKPLYDLKTGLEHTYELKRSESECLIV